MSATHFKSSLALLVVRSRPDYVHHPARVFLKRERLQPQEIASGRDLHVDEPKLAATRRDKHVGVRLLADFALELLPGVGNAVLVLLKRHLLLQPKLETVVVDEAD